MKGLVPYAGIATVGDTTGLALSTSDTQFNRFSAAVGQNMAAPNVGDPAVKADKANNRIQVNGPGLYRVIVTGSGKVDSAADLTLKVRKNGTVVSQLQNLLRIGTTDTYIGLSGTVEVTADDAATLNTFAEPATPTSPDVSFTGGAAAPKTGSYLDLAFAAASGTPTLTASSIRFEVERIG